MNPDVIFVGAGPVGLFTAINAKLQNPHQNILMFERNEQYRRKHILIINKNSYNNAHPDPRFQAILQKLTGPVPTTEIESTLRAFALELGIEIETKHITQVDELAQSYPSAHTIVGSDGAKSLVRQQIFNDEKDVEENLQYIVEVKYRSSTPTTALGTFSLIEGCSQINHFVQEHVGKTKNGETPVSLFFFVNQKTYNEIYAKGTSLTLEDIGTETPTMAELANSIHPWIAYRKYHKEDTIIPDSVRIAAVALNNYKSNTCAKEVNDKRYVLVGDAKLGIPYFRALNAGFIGGINAATLISQPEANNAYKSDTYNNDMNLLAQEEIANAYKTNRKVNMGRHLAWSANTSSMKLVNDSMSPQARAMIDAARVLPLNWFQRHKLLINSVVLFIAFTSLLFITGGIFLLPLGVILTTKLTLLGACALTGLAFTSATIGVYSGLASLISHLRSKPSEPQATIQETLDSDKKKEQEDLNEQEDPVLKRSYAHPAGLYCSKARQAPRQPQPTNHEHCDGNEMRPI